MKNKFKETGELNSLDLFKLSDQLVFENLIYNKNINPIINIISLIKAYTNGETKFPNFSEIKEWRYIIYLILDYIHFTNEDWTNFSYTDKLLNESKAAKYWVDKGFKITISEGKVLLDDYLYTKLSLEVEKKINSLGGQNVLEYLLPKIPFKKDLYRYSLLRNDNKLMIPYGYLINLSVKNFVKLHHKSTYLFQEQISELYEMATNFVALLQLQTFNPYSSLFIDDSNFIDYLYKNILYDKIINFRQYSPNLVPKIINGMLKNLYLENNLEGLLKINFDDLIQLIKYLLMSSPSFHKAYTVQQLRGKFPSIPEKILIKVLGLFSNNYKKVNKEFLHPNDIANFELKPLIQKKDKYILIDSAINSISFYESLCDYMRKVIENFDSKLGMALETFIKNELDNKNIKYSFGYYNINEECDLIIETSKFIFLIEIKKKAFTRKASSGNDVEIFKDIAKGLLSSQIQLGKREIELLKNGKIELHKNKGKRNKQNPVIHTIHHNDRIIERVSLNAWDYGIINDNLFSQNVLINLTGVTLGAQQTSYFKDLQYVNQISDILGKQFEIINKYTSKKSKKDNHRDIYFNCSFLSLQMFLTRIQEINNQLDFEKAMETLKGVTHGTGDPYFEFDYWRKIQNSHGITN